MVPGESAPTPLKVLFVCTANVARSPYAERRARVLLRRLPLEFESAGAPGYPGRPMDENLAEELRFRGGNPSGHVSRSLTSDMVAEADLVLTFEYEQRLRVLERWPTYRAKVLALRQLTEGLHRLSEPIEASRLPFVVDPDGLGSMEWEIEDPHGRGPEAARRCADQIDDALRHIARALGAQADDYPTRASRHRGGRHHWPWAGGH